MGGCISTHHKASQTKVQKEPFESAKPDHNMIIYPSSSSDKLSVIDGHVAVKPQLPPSQSPATFSAYGSKEETFFDSQAWLDSDCDDEFMSVNGEFTPSRGNTPVHHTSTLGVVNGGATSIDGSTPRPSPTPTERKKRLLDLFKESLRVRDNHGSILEYVELLDKEGKMSLNQVSLKSQHVGSRHGGCFSNLLYVRSMGRQQKKIAETQTRLSGN